MGGTAVALGIVEGRDLHIREADWPKYVASGIPKYNFVATGIPINIRLDLCSLVIKACADTNLWVNHVGTYHPATEELLLLLLLLLLLSK